MQFKVVENSYCVETRREMSFLQFSFLCWLFYDVPETVHRKNTEKLLCSCLSDGNK